MSYNEQLDYMKPIDLIKAQVNVCGMIDRVQSRHLLITQVLAALKPLDGKSVNKRFETAVQKAVPTYAVFYQKDYFGIKLTVWERHVKDQISFTLCRDEKDFNYATLEASCYLNGPQAVADMRAQLDKLKETVPAFNAALKAAQDAHVALGFSFTALTE